jgi:hypothetical protein
MATDPTNYQTHIYRKPDGSYIGDKSYASKLSDQQVADLILQSGTSIPASFLLEMMRNESGGIWNQQDTDHKADGKPIRTTYGLFQINLEDSISDDPLDPANNVKSFAKTMESYLNAIGKAAGFDPSDGVPTDAWYYLAWAHNYGLSTILTSIKNYGMNWAATKARPQSDHFVQKLVPYATRAVAGIAASGQRIAVHSTDSTMVIAGLLLAVGFGFLIWRYV